MEILNTIRDWIEHNLHLSPAAQEKILTSLIVVLVFVIIRILVLKVVFRRRTDIRVRYQWKKTSQYVAVILALFVLGRIWFSGFQSLATYLGLLSAGLAIALRDPIVNIMAWAFILWRRPFEVGDRIQIGDVSGDVIDLRIFQFSLMEIGNWVEADQSTGRIIHVNNGRVFDNVLANYSKGFQYIWNEIPVVITFESNWQKAKQILLEIARLEAEHLSEAAERKLKLAARKFMIFYKNLTPTVYTRVDDIGVRLTVRYLCDPRRRRGTEERLWESILEAFSAHTDIDFAYPTQRFYDNTREGKPGTRPGSIYPATGAQNEPPGHLT